MQIDMFIFLTFCMIISVYAKYDCGTNDVIYLDQGIIAYFETTNFPSLLSQKEIAACNLTFALAEKNTDSHFIISTTKKFFDINSKNIVNEKSFKILQTSFFSLQNYMKEENSFAYQKSALEGYVVFAGKNKTYGCLYGSETIEMFDEYQMVFLSDHGIFNLSSEDSCIWRFIAPQNYGFKIVITDLDDAVDTEFFIRNSTDTFVNKRSAKISFPHYNEDKYLEVEISNNRDTLFFAYVTVVNKTVSKDYCKTTKNATATTWHIDAYLMFPYFTQLNVKCFFELIIPESTEYVVTINAFILEKNVDYIRYTDIHNNSIDVDVDHKTNTVFKLFNYNNGSNARYLFEYSNDGSVPSLGTVITFEKLTCRCASSDIPCYGELFGKTGLMSADEGRYCGNLQCNFTIVPCLYKSDIRNMTAVTFRIEDGEDVIRYNNNDLLRTYTNGQLTAELNLDYFHATDTEIRLYFNFQNTTILEISTFPTHTVPYVNIITQVKPIPQILAYTTISSQNPFGVIDVGSYRATKALATAIKVTVTEDIKNPTLVLFSSVAHATELFNDESFSTLYNNQFCFGDFNKYSCTLNTTEFVIHCPFVMQAYPILTVHLPGYLQKGCVLNNYIFIANENSSTPIVAIATPADDCYITLLINLGRDYHYYFSKLWTTSLKENVKIYAGTDTKYFILEFNSHSAKKWTNIALYSNVYTIIVPKNTTIYLQLEKYDILAPVPVINVFGHLYALYHTAAYGVSKSSFIKSSEILYCSYGLEIKFTTLYYNTKSFSFYSKNDSYPTISGAGDTMVLKKFKCVYLEYIPDPTEKVDDGVIFLIETNEKNKTEIFP